MTTDEKYESLAYPGVYTDENEIIPYSPRRKFGFVSNETEESLDESKIIKLESMRHMSIDQIVQLYKYGYKIEDTYPDTYPTIETAQEGIYISTGALLLGVGIIALIYYLKNKGKI